MTARFQPRLFGGLPAADDMPTALQYVDEFEQSDTYPLP